MDDLEPQTPSTDAGPDTGTSIPLDAQTVATAPPPASSPQRKPDGAGRYWKWYLAALALGLAVIAGAVVANRDSGTATAEAAASTTTIATQAAADVSQSTGSGTATNAIQTSPALRLDARAVGQKVIPSVVTVEIQGAAFDGRQVDVGSGSGVIYDNQGHVITNNHVAAAGSSYEVVLSDGRVYPATVVGTDPTTDLAVLQISAQDLHPITIGSSDSLSVGDPAVAVGSPLGLSGGPSLTVGVISAFNRQVQTDASSSAGLDGMLQTDAPIISGSSGGALVNQDGALVGITTAVGVSPVGAEGIGFATPVEIVTRVADEIIANGHASIPYLGVQISTAMQDTTDGGSAPIGVSIESVVPNSAADQAGLKVGDVVSAIDGTQMRSHFQLIGQLRRYAAGDTIKMTLSDGRTINVTLGERPANQ